MLHQDDLKKQITDHSRRLQKLKEQQARYGIATEPHILTEIEDIEAELAELQAELEALPEITRQNPYRGLSAFREEDKDLFFGRESFTSQLVDSVQHKPLVAVLGPSGSGKSSIVFAGLLPCLRQEGRWLIAAFRPGQEPFRALAAALLPHLDPALSEVDQLVERRKMSEALSQGDLGLAEVTARLVEKNPPAEHLLIVADQFEELYTLCPDPDIRRHFLDLLLATFSPPSPPSPRSSLITHAQRSSLVLTLRADFLAQALAYRPLADALREADIKLGPMTPEELHRAIAMPTEVRGASFEPGLVERILTEVSGQPGKLPMLEFALTTLWDQQCQGKLTHAAYEAIGRVEGALSRYAEQIFAALNEAEQVQARRVFVQMIHPGEGMEDTRRLTRRDELAEVDWSLVQQLASARLVVTDQAADGQETVEVVHEALIRGWDRLSGWMNEDRCFRTWQERLRAALRQWEASGQDEGGLLRGAFLAEAEAWLAEQESELSHAEQTFIRAGVSLREQEAAEREAQRQHELEQQRTLAEEQRRRVIWVGGIGLVAIILAVVALTFSAQSRAYASLAEANAGRAATGEAQAVANAGRVATGEAQAVANAGRAATGEAQALQAQQEAQWQAQVALARQLGAQSQQLLDHYPNQLTLAVLLATESLRRYPEGVPNELLGKDLETLPHKVAQMPHDRYGQVRSVAFSPDGQRVVSGSFDGTARVWEAATGREIARMTHNHFVEAVAFSPDGRWVVSGSLDHTARVWEAATGREIARMTHDDQVDAVAFSPDGRWVVSSEGDLVKVWEAATGREIVQMGGWSPVAFSPDGRWILSGSGDNTARVWEAATGREIARMIHNSTVNAVAFSPDGRWAVSGEDDGTSRVWEIATGREVAQMHQDEVVRDVAFSPDGQWVVSGSFDGTVRVWEAATGREIARMTHDNIVYSVAFSPDGQWILSGSADTARVWEAATGREIARMEGGWPAAFSPDGQRVIFCQYNLVNIWEVETSAGEVARMTHDDAIEAMAFSPDGRWVLSGSGDNTARVWEAATGREIARMIHNSTVNAVAFSLDGRWAVSGEDDGTSRVWEIATGREVARMVHDDKVNTVAFSPDGRWVLSGSGSSDRSLRVWEAETGREIARVTHDDYIKDAAFSPDGRWVFSGGGKVAMVWGAATGREIARMTHDDYIMTVAFSPDGQRVVSGSADGTARVWEAATGREVARVTHRGYVMAVAFSPDSKWVVSGNSTALVWEAATGREVAPLFHDDGGVTAVVFSPDGKWVLSGSADNTMRVWEAATGHEVARMTHDNRVNTVAFSPDGRWVVSGDQGGTVKVYRWQPEELINLACARLARNMTRAEWRRFLGDEPYRATCDNLPIEEEQ